MTVSYVNTILFIADCGQDERMLHYLTITKNGFMHIKLEAAVLNVGVKTYSSEKPSQFKFLLWICGTQGRRETHTGFWWENLQQKDHL